MSLTLHFHPLASFCWKPLIALYENATPFTPVIVDLGDAESRAACLKISPAGKMPALRDDARGRTVLESSILVEYLAAHYPGPVDLVPAEIDMALAVRQADRFYDFYVQEPMQKIVGDRLRPGDKTDPFGVEQARDRLRNSYAIIEHDMQSKIWAMGDSFTMADCAASPALFYANKVEPLGDRYPAVKRYHDRLLQRPAFARVIGEAQPYFKFFPYNNG
ncbi:glutathione S-transferase family protein [Mesorhizobium sp. M7A.F.Ca.US.006.04.2.1]|uniref:glutathione S-transferase family protein n=1 Tax=unclassified Mesorhizobium TaxID=325217 RepID=UPI000FCC4A19|nr:MULTISPECIES: glutathione S-transferase family protein [unclassified Mesorhizobium]RUX75087.1 glutathione S-transferase family protein [Mesorhizobium sp. M7A.F.Ca.US.005.03.1.1]RUY14431.1 glutathione S-transferase family protein [Mesorhizobium sp. M7A.F.Ca.US.005.03.2.1]RUY25207.1 glutathione S-transferase family protein [Mesorhizobium sp. M7A.F.Ca.US.001.04.2.1]RUY40673.1 glutathione S-transferase family protein [Mesorhizobium sp. M7A.F.Ca.US.001.04.1.1]RVA00063.1 glutathione S-transferase